MNIRQALARSLTHNEIVACVGTTNEIETICSEADGSCDLVSQYGYVDVWGADEDGQEYRLYISPADEQCAFHRNGGCGPCNFCERNEDEL